MTSTNNNRATPQPGSGSPKRVGKLPTAAFAAAFAAAVSTAAPAGATEWVPHPDLAETPSEETVRRAKEFVGRATWPGVSLAAMIAALLAAQALRKRLKTAENKPATVQYVDRLVPGPTPAPEIKEIEKIVEVDKIVEIEKIKEVEKIVKVPEIQYRDRPVPAPPDNEGVRKGLLLEMHLSAMLLGVQVTILAPRDRLRLYGLDGANGEPNHLDLVIKQAGDKVVADWTQTIDGVVQEPKEYTGRFDRLPPDWQWTPYERYGFVNDDGVHHYAAVKWDYQGNDLTQDVPAAALPDVPEDVPAPVSATAAPAQPLPAAQPLPPVAAELPVQNVAPAATVTDQKDYLALIDAVLSAEGRDVAAVAARALTAAAKLIAPEAELSAAKETEFTAAPAELPVQASHEALTDAGPDAIDILRDGKIPDELKDGLEELGRRAYSNGWKAPEQLGDLGVAGVACKIEIIARLAKEGSVRKSDVADSISQSGMPLDQAALGVAFAQVAGEVEALRATVPAIAELPAQNVVLAPTPAPAMLPSAQSLPPVAAELPVQGGAPVSASARTDDKDFARLEAFFAEPADVPENTVRTVPNDVRPTGGSSADPSVDQNAASPASAPAPIAAQSFQPKFRDASWYASGDSEVDAKFVAAKPEEYPSLALNLAEFHPDANMRAFMKRRFRRLPEVEALPIRELKLGLLSFGRHVTNEIAQSPARAQFVIAHPQGSCVVIVWDGSVYLQNESRLGVSDNKLNTAVLSRENFTVRRTLRSFRIEGIQRGKPASYLLSR